MSREGGSDEFTYTVSLVRVVSFGDDEEAHRVGECVDGRLTPSTLDQASQQEVRRKASGSGLRELPMLRTRWCSSVPERDQCGID